jgi:outer membrane protein assembly factor BamB
MGARDKEEYVLALDDRGAEKWATKIGPVYNFKGNTWINGPNATPTVDGNLVFALGSQGELVCVDRSDKGKLVWRVNLPTALKGEINPVGGGPEKMGWGFAWSPLVDGDKLVCTPGGPQGLFAALDKKKGTVLWRSKGVPDQATYASPVMATINKVRQYITITQDSILGVSAEDGELLWRSKRENAFPDVVCATPIVQGNKVSVSIGYNVGTILLELIPDGKKFKVKEVYAEAIIGNKQGGVVSVGKFLYGYNEDLNGWVCQTFANGSQVWKSNPRKSLKVGTVIAADGRLYIVDESGFVGMVATGTPKYAELARFKLPAKSDKRMSRGGLWTHPAISDGKLYVRDQELVFCYQIK